MVALKSSSARAQKTPLLVVDRSELVRLGRLEDHGGDLALLALRDDGESLGAGGRGGGGASGARREHGWDVCRPRQVAGLLAQV